jgi:hypothetical protein
VTLGNHTLGPWVMFGYPLNDTSWLESQILQPGVSAPAFYRGVFTIPQNNSYPEPLDTYLDTTGWSKVCVIIAFIKYSKFLRYLYIYFYFYFIFYHTYGLFSQIVYSLSITVLM